MQQTDQAKQVLEDKCYCELHFDCKILAISFQEKYKRKSRLLCAKCMIDAFTKQEVSQLVYIQDLINDPADTIRKVLIPPERLKKIDENEVLLEIENLLVKLEDSIKNQFIILRQTIQQMRSYVCSITTELSNNLKLDDLVKQFELVRSMDSYQGTNELAQLEEQLNQISLNLMKAQTKLKDNQQLIVYNYKNNFQIISKEVEKISTISHELFQKIVTYEIMKVCDDINQFPQIHQLISEGKQIEYQLLYQGSRDGMNAKSYWAKCNQQSHLLTIMTSKNGNRFGGYSPCLINSALGNYVQDPTMKSFLFQYNKKEIYKLTNQACAVCCNAGCGPQYGGWDVYVGADFNSGSSNLGFCYDISGYYIPDKTTHIFGDKTPQLQEIKVYKVLF